MLIKQDMSELERTLQKRLGRTETGQSSKRSVVASLSKSHVDYWFSRLRKRRYRWNGKVVQIPNWQVRLQKHGREAWFNLGTSNQAAAARSAKEISTCLEANGWAAVLAKFKASGERPSATSLNVGDYLRAVEGTGKLRQRTFLNYQNCLRTIVSEAFGVKVEGSRFDYRKGGNQEWVARVDAIRLERVTPGRVMEWQRSRMKRAGHSPVALASAKRTANSYVRCARALFGRDILKRLKGLSLPTPLPFEGVELFEGGYMKYISKVNAQALIAAARAELKPDEPEVYKAFLLGLFAGMRKAEIDLVEWDMVDFQNGVINLEETEWLHLKTQDSAGRIAVDAEVMAELRDLMPGSRGTFVLASSRKPQNTSARAYYRCKPSFDRLNEWLRGKGVTANKPLHELRKEIGALVATQHGIYAASRFLRHSDVTTTARHYADHKARITVGLGKFLDPEIKPAEAATA